MNNLIKIKFPVDYIKFKDNKNNLIYRLIEIDSKYEKRYNDYRLRIETIFKDANIDDITSKIHSMIKVSFKDSKTLDFISNNQWLLKFASNSDIDKLCSRTNFKIAKEKVLIPYSAYIDKKYQRVFYKEDYVPIWLKRLSKYRTDLITWLFVDKYNTFDDRVNALILGDLKQARYIIEEYIWILMFVSEHLRKKICKQFKIPYSEFERTIGYTTSKKLVKKKTLIPNCLIHKYQKMETEIDKLYNSTDIKQSLLDYAYNHSKECLVNDENDLIRENLWLLNLVSLEDQIEILGLLDIKLNIPKKRIMTINTNNKSNINAYYYNLYDYEYDEYSKLSINILTILSKGDQLTDEEIIEFINSSYLVLEIWPWIVDYIKDEQNKEKIIKKKKQ